LTERLEYWAAVAPERTYLAQRAASGWRKISYGETLEQVRRIGAALLRRDLSPERPIAILSGNDIEHALIGLAAMYVGIPYAPISPAYALISNDFERLRSIIDLIPPGLVFAADGDSYARAIGAAVRPDVEVVVTRNPISGRPTTLFETLLVPTPPGAADATHGSVSPDSIAKLLFTSGSTGAPKAVINTQRMWCSNQAMILSQLAFFADEPPVIVDWSPWHHTAVPGVELKLVPREGKLEARLRGPNIMPGYWRQHDLTVQAFDEDGFYKLGDALNFEDPGDPRAGLLFDGRVAEDFKLTSGTWVNVGPLRARLLAQLEPYARDVVIAGADRDEIGALIFPNLEACRTLAAAPAADVTGDT